MQPTQTKNNKQSFHLFRGDSYVRCDRARHVFLEQTVDLVPKHYKSSQADDTPIKFPKYCFGLTEAAKTMNCCVAKKAGKKFGNSFILSWCYLFIYGNIAVFCLHFLLFGDYGN